jgi:hypothetical protein
MKDIFGFVEIRRDKKSSMSFPSINICGCRRDVRVDGIGERRFFSVILYYGSFFSFVVYIFFSSPRLFSDN